MSESEKCIAQEAADAIKKMAPGFTPVIAMTLGSGCGDVANSIVDPIAIDYGKIPGFPVSSVQGHAGQLILGKLAGVPVVGLKGRVHYYEGNPRSMVVPVYTMKLLGAKHLFITNAAGSLREEMGPGALVALTDHMNFSGANPLIGPNDAIGPRFPSLFQAYDPKLRDILKSVAAENNITLHEASPGRQPPPPVRHIPHAPRADTQRPRGRVCTWGHRARRLRRPRRSARSASWGAMSSACQPSAKSSSRDTAISRSDPPRVRRRGVRRWRRACWAAGRAAAAPDRRSCAELCARSRRVPRRQCSAGRRRGAGRDRCVRCLLSSTTRRA
jgi:hypothetical protein